MARLVAVAVHDAEVLVAGGHVVVVEVVMLRHCRVVHGGQVMLGGGKVVMGVGVVHHGRHVVVHQVLVLMLLLVLVLDHARHPARLLDVLRVLDEAVHPAVLLQSAQLGRRAVDGVGGRAHGAGRLGLAVVPVVGAFFRLGTRSAAAGSTFSGPAGPVASAAAGRVGLDVFGEVIGAHEALVAHGAGEPLLARVGAEVALELVGSREALAAKEPIANERPLPGVPAEVGLEVTRLAVHFPAARDVAAVDVALPKVGAGRA